MKIALPKVSTHLEHVSIERMVDDGELELAYLSDVGAINCNVAALKLIDVRLERIQFTGAHFSRIVARDVVARQIDFSQAYLDNGLLVRSEFTNCRMTGVDFSATSIHDVTFRDCKLDGAVFAKADLRRVAFIGCSLDGVDLTAAHCFSVELA